jgi:hypothetical protein
LSRASSQTSRTRSDTGPATVGDGRPVGLSANLVGGLPGGVGGAGSSGGGVRLGFPSGVTYAGPLLVELAVAVEGGDDGGAWFPVERIGPVGAFVVDGADRGVGPQNPGGGTGDGVAQQVAGFGWL